MYRTAEAPPPEVEVDEHVEAAFLRRLAILWQMLTNEMQLSGVAFWPPPWLSPPWLSHGDNCYGSPERMQRHISRWVSECDLDCRSLFAVRTDAEIYRLAVSKLFIVEGIRLQIITALGALRELLGLAPKSGYESEGWICGHSPVPIAEIQGYGEWGVASQPGLSQIERIDHLDLAARERVASVEALGREFFKHLDADLDGANVGPKDVILRFKTAADKGRTLMCCIRDGAVVWSHQ